MRGAGGRPGAGAGVRGAAHLRPSCGLRAERAALQAALPRSGESAGAGGTGSERRAEGETGAPAAAGPRPTSKGEAPGLSPLPPPPPPHSTPRPQRPGIQFPFPSTTLFVLQQEPPGPGPDMTILCDPETLFYESPHLTLEGLPPLRLQLRPRPSEDTFLMHRTLRRWEA